MRKGVSVGAVLLVLFATALWSERVDAGPRAVRACVNDSSGAVRITDSQCLSAEALLVWSLQGSPGPTGAQGASGLVTWLFHRLDGSNQVVQHVARTRNNEAVITFHQPSDYFLVYDADTRQPYFPPLHGDVQVYFDEPTCDLSSAVRYVELTSPQNFDDLPGSWAEWIYDAGLQMGQKFWVEVEEEVELDAYWFLEDTQMPQPDPNLCVGASGPVRLLRVRLMERVRQLNSLEIGVGAP